MFAGCVVCVCVCVCVCVRACVHDVLGNSTAMMTLSDSNSLWMEVSTLTCDVTSSELYSSTS